MYTLGCFSFATQIRQEFFSRRKPIFLPSFNVLTLKEGGTFGCCYNNHINIFYLFKKFTIFSQLYVSVFLGKNVKNFCHIKVKVSVSCHMGKSS